MEACTELKGKWLGEKNKKKYYFNLHGVFEQKRLTSEYDLTVKMLELGLIVSKATTEMDGDTMEGVYKINNQWGS